MVGKHMSNKMLFRVAVERALLDEPQQWFAYLDARNKKFIRPVRQRQFGEIGKIGIVRFAEFMV